MKKKRFTEQQIIGFLKEAEAGVAVKELCRKYGFSDAAFYGWRSKFGGMQVNEARRLRELEALAKRHGKQHPGVWQCKAAKDLRKVASNLRECANGRRSCVQRSSARDRDLAPSPPQRSDRRARNRPATC